MNVSTAESNLAGQQTRLDESVRNLEILLGRYPSGLIAIKGDLPEIEDSIPAGIPSELLNRRPDLIAARETLSAVDSSLRDQEKNFLPSVSLTGSGGTTGEKFKNLFNFNFLVWSIASNLVQPIF